MKHRMEPAHNSRANGAVHSCINFIHQGVLTLSESTLSPSLRFLCAASSLFRPVVKMVFSGMLYLSHKTPQGTLCWSSSLIESLPDESLLESLDSSFFSPPLVLPMLDILASLFASNSSSIF